MSVTELVRNLLGGFKRLLLASLVASLVQIRLEEEEVAGQLALI